MKENSKEDLKKKRLIRKQAEMIMEQRSYTPPENSQELEKVLYELNVHQIELELQNQELHKAQEDLENARDRYIDLYDNSPVGYLTIDDKDFIVVANRKVAQMLGWQKGELTGARLAVFVADSDKLKYQKFLLELTTSLKPGSLDLLLERKNGGEFHAHIEALSISNSKDVLAEARLSVTDITQQKNDEKALIESQERVRRIVETATEGIVLIDKGQTVVFTNNSFLQLLGYGSDEILGRHFRSFISGDDLKLFESKMHSAASGETRRFEVRLIKKDGSLLWAILSMVNFYERDEASAGTLAMITDLTEHIKSEQARRRIEGKLGLAMEASGIGFWEWNFETGEINYDHKYARILGYEPEEIGEFTITAWRKIVHPDDLDDVNDAFDRHVEEKSPFYEVEHRIKTSLGSWNWYMIRGRVIEFDKNAKPSRIIGTVMDITTHKAVIHEKARTDLLDKLRTINTVDECLAAGCQAVNRAGLFQHALMTIHDKNCEVVHWGQFGLGDSWKFKNDFIKAPGEKLISKLHAGDFQVSRSYFARAEAQIDVAGTTLCLGQSHNENEPRRFAWKPGDGLYVPFGEKIGPYDGWLTVDIPINGKRPTRDLIEYVEGIMDIIGTRAREVLLNKELEIGQRTLEEKNIALKEILSSIEEEKSEIKKDIARLTTDVLIPAVRKMVRKNGTVNTTYYGLLQSHLKDLAESTGRTLPITFRLSPRELEICHMIKNGSNSKEIAESLDIALVTVLKHREVIRRKLGLTNKSVNLTSHLRTL